MKKLQLIAETKFDRYRVGVVGLIKNNKDQILICKMPKDRGMFPGQWAIPGGGMEAGETITQALKREMKEEVGIEIGEIKPIYFTDDARVKLYSDGRKEYVYMVYLVCEVKCNSNEVLINEEFESYVWVDNHDLGKYDLNIATKNTFTKLGLL